MIYCVCTDCKGACWDTVVKRQQIIDLFKFVKEMGAETFSSTEFDETTIWFKFEDMDEFRTLCSYEIDPRPFGRMIDSTPLYEDIAAAAATAYHE